jgi:GTP cyclohydrolase IA
VCEQSQPTDDKELRASIENSLPPSDQLAPDAVVEDLWKYSSQQFKKLTTPGTFAWPGNQDSEYWKNLFDNIVKGWKDRMIVVDPPSASLICPPPARKQSATVYERIKNLARELLEAIGEDPDREGLRETPRRFADWWREFLEYDPGTTDTTFEATHTGSLVAVTGMRVYSLCEHHLLPFWCDVSIAYFPTRQVLGLSKFARIAHKYAHRLQLQERLCNQIADEVQEVTGSPDVAVVCRGEHSCMTMRGIKTAGMMTSMSMRGVFEAEDSKRMEFLRLIEM